MRRYLIPALLIVVPFSVHAAGKPCDALKAEIQAKLEAKQVKNYSLEIVAADATGDGKIVGSCEAGTKKIVYSRK